MSINLPRPLIYLITSGKTTNQTSSESPEFLQITSLIEAAVAAGVSLIQIREKQLSARMLYDLACRAAAITRGSESRLLINDRADIALAAGADGVQLTTKSMPTDIVAGTFRDDFLIGVSTHSLAEAGNARQSGADFVLFGPIFETESKSSFGKPQGIEKLHEVSSELDGFPVIAIGGIKLDNVEYCFRNGASGVAAISLLQNRANLAMTVAEIKEKYRAIDL